MSDPLNRTKPPVRALDSETAMARQIIFEDRSLPWRAIHFPAKQTDCSVEHQLAFIGKIPAIDEYWFPMGFFKVYHFSSRVVAEAA